MAVTVTKLREDIYNLIDQVIETGIPLEIKRDHTILKIVPEKPKNILDNLREHSDTIVGDPDELIHIDWSSYWTEENKSILTHYQKATW